ncbi:phospholipase D-like domain-containing protein, partial [Salinicoccus hispanicus]|uniref:phospholipase D-like domain-containing protein n=1 Tax=Salinicoccus hispanicus TaxID=157225 RepID=UPI003615350E
MEINKENLLNAYERGFVNRDIDKVGHHPPRMIINSKEENVLSSMLDEMEVCDSFSISVAFITEGGLATLKTTLHELAKRNVKGRIITSTYLNFNKPKVFKALLGIPNIEVRVTGKEGFHAKGYVFRNRHYTSMFIGSSNLTDAALKKNYEYNLKLTSLENGAVIQHFNSQFEVLWNDSAPVDDAWVDAYAQSYVEEPMQRKVLEVIEDRSKYRYRGAEGPVIKPNAMQHEALNALDQLRQTGKDKGLVVSATGTGRPILRHLM